MDARNSIVKELLLGLEPYHRLYITPSGISVESVKKVSQEEAQIDALLKEMDLSTHWLVAYHHPGQPLTITIGNIAPKPLPSMPNVA